MPSARTWIPAVLEEISCTTQGRLNSRHVRQRWDGEGILIFAADSPNTLVTKSLFELLIPLIHQRQSCAMTIVLSHGS